MPQVSAEPLRRLVEVDPVEFARRYEWRFEAKMGAGTSAVKRLREQALLSPWMADRICVVLGVHMSQVYPELYSDVR